MCKIRCNKFSKFVPLLRCWWPEVAWFGQIVILQTNYDEIELLKNQLW